MSQSTTATVDAQLLQGIRDNDPRCFTTLTLTDPFVDVDVISDIDLPDNKPGSLASELRRLRAAFRAPGLINPGCHLLVSLGDMTTTQTSPEPLGSFWRQQFEGLRSRDQQLLIVPGNHDVNNGAGNYYADFGSHFVMNPPSDGAREYPVAHITRVMLGSEPEPRAYIAVIGFDSNDGYYQDSHLDDSGRISEKQLAQSRELVKALVSNAARNTPLFLIAATHHNLIPLDDRQLADLTDTVELRKHLAECSEGCLDGRPSPVCAVNSAVARSVAGIATNGSSFLRHCQDLRMSLVLHGRMQRREVTVVANMPLERGRGANSIPMLACPPLNHEPVVSGMARVRLNVVKAEAEIAFAYQNIRENVDDGRTMQIVRPLVSASRVSASERQLLSRVRDDLAKAKDDGVQGADGFSTRVETEWDANGQVALCTVDGALPDFAAVRSTVTYNLLLLLRERGDSRQFDMLLSHHTPLHPNPVANWDTLLMPAFRDVRDLLEHLRDDVVRQVADQAVDLSRARQVRAFQDAVDRILDTPERDVWTEEVREIARTTRTKISPTTGFVTNYEYRLVTLMPLVRPAADSGENEQRRQDFQAIISWLNELPYVDARDSVDDDTAIPMKALRAGGRGLRWDPENSDGHLLVDTGPAPSIPPGAVWFPLPDYSDSLDSPPWRQCPSIVARNADVMTWVDAELKRQWRPADGTFPAELVMGRLTGRSRDIEIVERYGFASTGTVVDDPEIAAPSTEEALRRVTYVADYDLKGLHPYRDLEIKRVHLVRLQPLERPNAREVIAVIDADRFSDPALARRSADWLGVLRPVQRYVMQSGLERARELQAKVLDHLDDRWGYARIQRGGAGRLVSVTPPIIEQVAEDDNEGDGNQPDFLVCDGNHRIVELCWNQRRPLQAVAMVGRPYQPYYAHPFGKYEWHVTAGKEVRISPDNEFKYNARTVDLEKLDPEARGILSKFDERLHYRRYFRDLNTGFVYVGGQGGNYL